jgi:hypothetical protein
MNKKLSTNVDKYMYEKVNMDVLKKLMSSENLPSELRSNFEKYYESVDNRGEVLIGYYHSKYTPKMGRLFPHKLSLCNMSKEFRCALAKDIYLDIDMVNSIPNILYRYCRINRIKTFTMKKGLGYYVRNREKVLNEVMEKHNIDRDQAKDLAIRLCNLGGYFLEKPDENGVIKKEYIPKDPELRVETLHNISLDCIDIAQKIYESNPKLAEIACNKKIPDEEFVIYDDEGKEYGKDEEYAILGRKWARAMSINSYDLENDCLMAIVEFFISHEYKVGVLCYDGIMVEKTKKLVKDIDDILVNCEDFVFNKTRYRISLKNKEMNTKLSFELPQFSNYVENDEDAMNKLFEIEGKNKFIYCEKNLYIFDEKTGMFDNEIETLNYYIRKNKNYLRFKRKGKYVSYGEETSLMPKLIPCIKSETKDNNWTKNTDATSLGYLLYKNGIYNMKTGEFKKEFTPKIVFHHMIDRDFPERVEKNIEYVRKVIFETYFGSQNQTPESMIIPIAVALSGDNDLKTFNFGLGKTNTGKSVFIRLLSEAFGGYVDTFNAGELAKKSQLDSKDSGAKCRWALEARWKRLLLSSEISMTRPLDGNDIKKYSSGGDKIKGRNHFEADIGFYPHFTIFCMLNDIPEIEPHDDAVCARETFVEFNVIKNIDTEFKKKILTKKYLDAFSHIIFDGYKEFLKTGILPPRNLVLKQKYQEDETDEQKIINIINDTFIITNDKKDRIPASDMKFYRPKGISPTKYTQILLENFNIDRIKSGSWYYTNIKRKSD